MNRSTSRKGTYKAGWFHRSETVVSLRWNKSFTILKLLFLLASCTADITQPSDNPEEDGRIPLLIKNITLEENSVITRAATAPAVGSVIGVFRQTDSYYTTASNNIKYTRTADKGWQVAAAGTDILLGADDSRALLYAYHPSNDKITVAADNVSVDLAAREYDADYDLSYVAAGNAQALDISGVVYNYHPGVNFPMKHAYTRLGVDLTRGDNYGGVGTVTAVSLTLHGGGKLYSTGTQNIATGNYTAGTADLDKLTYTVPADRKIIAADKTASFSYLLPPGKSGAISNLLLTVTVDGVTTTTVISAAGLDLKAGTNYVVKATLDYYGLTAATLKTTDWDSQPAWNEEVGFVPIIPPIDIGLPFVIAPGNLIATAKSDGSGYTYTFAPEQGYYSGSRAGGDYFAWNTLLPTENTGNPGAWNDALDPCRQVEGGEWRTPTKAQWDILFAASTTNNSGGTYHMRDGSRRDGAYFGITTNPSTAEQNKYVFLPAGGYYNRDGSYQNYREAYGYYLSSTPDETTGRIHACEVDMPSSYMVYMTSINRDGGYSVRCVKDKPLPEHAIEVEGLDFYVSDGNVRAISDGAGGYTYQFAEEQGYYSGDASGGDYFCWNTLDPTATTSTNITNVWEDANDVCRKIGDGKWYTPTESQWRKVIDLKTKCAGVYTMKSNTWVHGCYLGTTSVPGEADQNKYVFFPYPGRYDDTGWSDVHSHGYYWTTFPVSFVSGQSYTYYVYGSDDVYDGVHEFKYSFRQSVRCFRDK